MKHYIPLLVLVLGPALPAQAQEADLKAVLAKPILAARQTQSELQRFLEARLPELPKPPTKAEWEKEAKRIREEMFAKVVFRGEAAKWRASPMKVDWLDVVAGGPGYQIKKVRFEAVPGLWIPAVLYEPEKLKGKVPATLNVMGHDGGGKDVEYQQVRCINLAKRGMLALNVEWFNFGQLAGKGYRHTCMNQLDMCGTSGLAPFYLALERGLDVLLSHPNADPERVAVSGLSGGGWQTIWISALDTRVTLSNPVAGYSSFRTRIKHWKDLGDPEQTPCDMATIADYDHLTAMMAPRATLLTYNAKDECCFEAGYALPRLYDGALPFFDLFGRGKALRTHVNDVPGTHNYLKENREAFYQMIGDHFFAGDKSYTAEELACDKEIKHKKELEVPLPENLDFNKLALALAKTLPREQALPTKNADQAITWQKAKRAELTKILRLPSYSVTRATFEEQKAPGAKTIVWRIELDKDWTIPLVELSRGEPKGTTLVFCDGGRAAAAGEIDKLLEKGRRVLAVDPFFLGECRMPEREYLWALLVQTVGQRPLGVQAAQAAALTRWSLNHYKTMSIDVLAIGPRTSLLGLVLAGLELDTIAALELTAAKGSLKEALEENRTFDQAPEIFCFGLLEAMDLKHLAALLTPREVRFRDASARVQSEMGDLRGWYRLFGVEWDVHK